MGGMEVVGFVVIGLLVAFGVVRHWNYADNPMMRGAEDATTITGRQWVAIILVILAFTALGILATS